MGRLGKFLRLNRCDQVLLIHALLLLAAVRLGLWLLSFRQLQMRLERSSCPSFRPGSAINGPTPDRVAWAVTAASRYIPRSTCLAQALTAQSLLARYGNESSLHFGVAKPDGSILEAHAWLECGGRVVFGGGKPDGYVGFPSWKKETR